MRGKKRRREQQGKLHNRGAMKSWSRKNQEGQTWSELPTPWRQHEQGTRHRSRIDHDPLVIPVQVIGHATVDVIQRKRCDGVHCQDKSLHERVDGASSAGRQATGMLASTQASHNTRCLPVGLDVENRTGSEWESPDS